MSLDAHLKGGRSGARLSDATVPLEEQKQSPIAHRQLSYDLEGRTQPQPQPRITSEQYRAMVLGHGHKLTQIHELKYDIPEGRVPLTNVPKVEETSKITETPKTEAPPKTELPKKMEDPKEPPKAEAIPPEAPKTATPLQYRIVGSVFHSYVIVELQEKMLLIDQHAAHERILFEQLKAGMQNAEPTAQMLMLPVAFEFSPGDVQVIADFREEIEAIGFVYDIEDKMICVHGIPCGIEITAVEDIFATIAERIRTETGSAQLTRDILFEKALYPASCKAAIKAGRAYASEHIAWICDKLMRIPDITVCPHGRPVAMTLSRANLDRQFKRS
jgi:DNA mismatch repair protein MutL